MRCWVHSSCWAHGCCSSLVKDTAYPSPIYLQSLRKCYLMGQMWGGVQGGCCKWIQFWGRVVANPSPIYLKSLREWVRGAQRRDYFICLLCISFGAGGNSTTSFSHLPAVIAWMMGWVPWCIGGVLRRVLSTLHVLCIEDTHVDAGGNFPPWNRLGLSALHVHAETLLLCQLVSHLLCVPVCVPAVVLYLQSSPSPKQYDARVLQLGQPPDCQQPQDFILLATCMTAGLVF